MLGANPEEGEILDVLIDNLSSWAADRVDAARIDAEGEIPRELLTELAEMGLFGLSLPEKFGGAEMSLIGVCDLMSHFAKADRSVATTVGLHLGLGTRGLVAFGPEALQQRYLPDLAEGTKLAAFGATEANAGSDLSAVATKAVLSGDRLQVNGTKIFVTNGGLADLYTFLVSTPGLGGARRGHSMLLFERGDAGLSVGAEEEKLGLHGSSTTSIYLDNVEIPAERVIGEAGQGMPQIGHVLAWGRTVMAAGCIGTARAAFERTLAHVAVRKQFGKTLAELDVVKAQLAEMAATLFAMGAMVRHAAVDDRVVLDRRSLATKVLCSEGSWEVCDRGIQLHGGPGFTEETGMPLLLRDTRVTRIFEGANDVLLVRIGAERLTQPKTFLPTPWDDALNEHLAALKKKHGLRVLRKQRDLWQLGQLTVLGESVNAVQAHAAALNTDQARALAAQWTQMAGNRSLGYLAPLETTDVAEGIAQACLNGSIP